MLFEINDIIKYPEGERFRILHSSPIHPGYWLFSLDAENAWPFLKHHSELAEEVVERRVHLLDSSSLGPQIQESDLTVAERARKDKAWDAIKNVVDQIPEIFIPRMRAALIREVEKMHGLSRPTLYAYLRAYWYFGQTPIALIPAFANCGAKGKKRKPSRLKLGRPRSTTPGVGVNVNDDDLQVMEVAYAKYLKTSNELLKTAYEWFLLMRYPDDIKVEQISGRTSVTILEPNKIITYEQFCYHYHKRHTRREELIKKHGSRNFEQIFGPRLSNSLIETVGTAARYQIDATVADVYLVSTFDSNRIVGRPVIYKIVDVFSRLIVGLYVSLDPPSWSSAMLALASVAQDKSAYCAKFGLELFSGEWPTAEMPVAILGDRGEMASILADLLVQYFHIEIENTSPYRGDLKGIIERLFYCMHTNLRPGMPGYVDPTKIERGQRDYRLDACLTLDEFTRCVILSVLNHNHAQKRSYPGDQKIVADGVPYAPIALWNWARENGLNCGRKFDAEFVKRCLLPRRDVTVTREGLRLFEGLHYSHPEMMAEPWYLPAQENRLKLSATYHPGDVSEIYVFSPKDRSRSFRCALTPASARFAGAALADVEAFRDQERIVKKQHEPAALGNRLGYAVDIQREIAQARERTKRERDPALSNRERLADISANKRAEADWRRRDQSRLYIGTNKPDGVTPTPSRSESDDDFELDLIARLKDRLNRT